MATTRIYVVTSEHVSGQFKQRSRRLVEASHPANALRHVAVDMLRVSVAKQAELVELINAGVKVEQVGVEQGELPVGETKEGAPNV